jgi:alcohol dehydrogenase
MKKAFLEGKGQVVIKDVDKPKIEHDDDVILKLVRASVCGSDLWFYRGIDPATNDNSGHECIGIVEETGSAITTVKKGDFVIAPFTHGCGHCAACLAGYDGNCLTYSDIWSADCQAEYVRYQHGQWALVKIPGQPEDYSDGMLASLQALSDVMPTGYHAARSANVQKGDTAVVIGDGAVGLCGVISAKLRGASRIILMSRHEDRASLGREFGATDVVAERGDEAVAKVMELTNNAGADAVLECVGSRQSMEEALKMVRPGAVIGRVGVPHDEKFDLGISFHANAGITGGTAAVTTYDKGFLLKAVLDGDIQPGKVFTKSYKLDDIEQAYADMDQRKTIKSLLTF